MENILREIIENLDNTNISVIDEDSYEDAVKKVAELLNENGSRGEKKLEFLKDAYFDKENLIGYINLPGLKSVELSYNPDKSEITIEGTADEHIPIASDVEIGIKIDKELKPESAYYKNGVLVIKFKEHSRATKIEVEMF